MEAAQASEVIRWLDFNGCCGTGTISQTLKRRITIHRDSGSSWRPPEHGWIKVNFDFGLEEDSNSFTVGTIAHNHTAECCGWSFVSKPGKLNTYDGELVALLGAIKCAKSWPCVVFEGDNNTVISDATAWVFGSSTPSLPLAIDLVSLVAKFQRVMFSFVTRSSNVLAHNIAKRISCYPPNMRMYSV